MDEIVDLVVEKTGLPRETAKIAVDAVLEFVKDRLPDPIASQLDGFLDGENPLGDADNIMKTLGGLFGNK